MNRSKLLLFFCILVTPSAHAETRSLSVDDYFRLREVSDPRVSPDGEWIAYVVTTHDLEEDEVKRRIWMVPAAGGDPVPMTVEESSASAPRWSPDGKYLAFLSSQDDEEAQVFALYRHGGEAVELTKVEQGVSSYAWSPDGSRLVLVVQDPEDGEAAEKDNDDDDEETKEPWVIDRLQFKRDYVGYLDRRRTHLYLLDLNGGEPTQITFGDYDDSEPAWSPDGSRIAFVSNRTEEPDSNYNTDIWIVTLGEKAEAREPVRISTNPGEDSSPVWSPDGERIAYVSATDVEAMVYATFHLAVAPARGGAARILTRELDRHVSSPVFSRDGRHVYFLIQDRGEQPLARVPVEGGSVARLVEGESVVESFHLGETGPMAALVAKPHLPAEVFALEDGALRQVTHTNRDLLGELRLGEVEKVRFPSRDGTEIEAFVVKPPDFDRTKRYPTLLRIHGGPVSQYDHRFHFEAQLFAAHGYVVVLPNPRGSSGYGQDFSLGIWQSWGERDYEDVMASVDYVIGMGYGDPERLGVGGWSYGGMLTNHVITKTDRFDAAITGASATLYVANYGHDQYQRWWEGELGLPWKAENRELWERLSPFNRVEEIETPTLIVGGEKDWNVPIINSEQLYLALRRLRRTVELVVYPGEFHSIRKPSYRKDLYERYLDWYGRYVKEERPVTQ